MEIQSLLKSYGLSEKEIAVYMALVELGPNPVRIVAAKSKVNRGTTYDILKSLMDQGLVTYYHQKTHQYFAAEPPEKLVSALEARQAELEGVKEQIKVSLPSLKTLYARGGGRPTVKQYEGMKGIRQILEDVLATVGSAKDKQYFIYSSATIRKDVHTAMPDFSDKRIKQKISVKSIALGDGGRTVGLDERKWLKLNSKQMRPTYEIIYAGKVAHISLDDAENPVGVVIENQEIYDTQKIIFEQLWSKL